MARQRRSAPTEVISATSSPDPVVIETLTRSSGSPQPQITIGLSRWSTMCDWNKLWTHRPSPTAGTSITSRRGSCWRRWASRAAPLVSARMRTAVAKARAAVARRRGVESRMERMVWCAGESAPAIMRHPVRHGRVPAESRPPELAYFSTNMPRTKLPWKPSGMWVPAQIRAMRSRLSAASTSRNVSSRGPS